MSDPTPPAPWISLGECPFCVNGLVRIRTCEDLNSGKHFFAMCDECEAIWVEPNLESQKQFPDPENASCPICQQSLYGIQAHWSTPDELTGTTWGAVAIYDLPSSQVSDEDPELTPAPEDFLTVDDLVGTLDVPSSETQTPEEIFPATGQVDLSPMLADLEHDEPQSPDVDIASDDAYGQDHPKPGC